jgi:hypothetical protein
LTLRSFHFEQQLKDYMQHNLKTLEAELTALELQIQAIDLEPLRQGVAAADTAFAAYQPARATGLVDSVESDLTRAVGEAQQALEHATNKARDLDRTARPLRSWLGAPNQVKALTDDADTAARRMADTAALVASASRTVEALQALTADAQAEYQSHCEASAKAILQAAKAGQAVAPTTPDRSHITGLESALVLALAELTSAEQAHSDAVAAHAEALRALGDAQTESAALLFEIEVRNFCEAAVTFNDANGAFDPDDLHERIAIIRQMRGESVEGSHSAQSLRGYHDSARATAPGYARDHLQAGAFKTRRR